MERIGNGTQVLKLSDDQAGMHSNLFGERENAAPGYARHPCLQDFLVDAVVCPVSVGTLLRRWCGIPGEVLLI